MSGALGWMGEAREKAVLDICNDHIRKVVDTVVSMDKALQGFCNLDRKKVDEGFKEAFKNEREADEVKRKILEELSRGIIHPINRDDIIKLTTMADDVAENAKAAARKLRYVDPKKLSKELRRLISVFSKELTGIVDRTHEAFIALRKDPKSAIILSREVERLEEKIDDLRAEKLIPELMKFYRRINDIGLALLLKEITDNMENVADYCENVSDIVRYISISHI